MHVPEDEQEQPLLEQAETPHLDAQIESLGRATNASYATGWEDPDDTVGLLDAEEEAVGETIFKPEAEAQLLEGGANPTDGSVVMKQGILCGALICISIYEAIFKSKAVREAKFDFTSLLIMQSILSITIGLGLAAYNHETTALAPKELARNILRFAPPGVLFGAASYISMIALVYLSADVFKVLEQTRLLVMGVFGYFLMRKRLSTASWIALIAITLTCLTYGRMKVAEGERVATTKEIMKNVVRSEKLHEHLARVHGMPREMSADGLHLVHDVESMESSVLGDSETSISAMGDVVPLTVGELSQQQAVDVIVEAVEEIAEASHQKDAKDLLESLKQLANGERLSQSTNPLMGFALTGIFILISCFASVYSEIVLKKDKHIPFYVQKVFLEIAAGAFAIFASFVLRPILINNDIAAKKLAISFAERGLFYGWDNTTVPILFCFCAAKSWLSGIICKQLSSIAKQLCSIVAVVVLYFFILMHDCKDGSFMCPSGIANASFNIVIIDMAVLCSVISYTAALRDKKRKTMFKEQLKEQLSK